MLEGPVGVPLWKKAQDTVPAMVLKPQSQNGTVTGP